MKNIIFIFVLLLSSLTVEANNKVYKYFFFHINVGELEFQLYRVGINKHSKQGELCVLSTMESTQITDKIGEQLLNSNDWSKYLDLEKDVYKCESFNIYSGINDSFFIHNLKYQDMVYSYFFVGNISNEVISGEFHEYTIENVDNRNEMNFYKYSIHAQ